MQDMLIKYIGLKNSALNGFRKKNILLEMHGDMLYPACPLTENPMLMTSRLILISRRRCLSSHTPY